MYRCDISRPDRFCANPTTGAGENSGTKLVENGGVKLSIHSSCGIRLAANGSSAWNSSCPARGPAQATGRYR